MVESAPNEEVTLQGAGERIVDGLADVGVAVVPGFLSPQGVHELRAEGERRRAKGEFHGASVGRAGSTRRDTSVRGDSTCWLDAATGTTPERALLARFADLGVALNRTLMMGIVEVEAHYARYPPGAGYARHLDRFRDDDARVVSLVLYLNEEWADADGGALRLYGRSDVEPAHDLPPRGGTLVAMRSDVIEHEVLPATVERWSIAAWLRRRAC
jgi:SM-20-related protein